MRDLSLSGPSRAANQFALLLTAGYLCVLTVNGENPTAAVFRGQAPPPAPPVLHRSFEVANTSRSPLSVPSGLTLYSIGEPTDEEQLYLEYINRARLNPSAEGRWLQELTDADVRRDYSQFAVDLGLMASQFASLTPAAPLSMNPHLTAAARLHSRDMLENAFQGHVGTDGSNFATRASAQGYPASTVGENVYAHADSVLHGHTGFEVDWGGDATTGGMQEPPGHRLNIHNPSFREVGVGVVHGTNDTFGPQVVTQDFGSRRDLTPFITGVVYYDLNGNHFYDLGEGLGGVRVLANGSTFYAITARSGGYSLPAPENGEYAVTFSVPGLADSQTNAVLQGANVKVDHVMSYSPPELSGSDTPAVGDANAYSFQPVGGATGYQWRYARLVPVILIEGAEDGLNNFTASVSESYPVIDNMVQASGTGSFRLAHPTPDDQILTLTRTFRAGPMTQLSFSTRLSWASSHQVARAQISVDDGNTWADVWNQAGSGDAGDVAFATQNISLGPFAGAEFNLRFVYDIAGGRFFPQTEPGFGFYIDDIIIGNAHELLDQTFSEVTSTSVGFVPPEPGSYALSVRPKVSERFLPWGPTKLVQAQVGSAPNASVRLTSIRPLADGRVQIDFSVANPGAGVYQVQTAADLDGPWLNETAASVENVDGASGFRALAPASSAAQRFYRIVVE